MRTGHREFSIVFIPTWACNCTCDHCFEKIMGQAIEDESWEIFFIKIHSLVKSYCIKKLSIYWQGGEVFCMDASRVRKGLETGAQIFKDSDCIIEHHMQTNLLLYNKNWGEIISDYFSGSISSSLDFPNMYRTTPLLDHEGYTKAWMKKKDEAEKDGFIVSVVTLPNVKTLEIGVEPFHRFFKDEVGIRNIQINFPFPGVNRNKPLPMNLDRLAGFMEELYTIWIASGRYLNLNPFAPLENRIFRNNGTLSCAWSYCCADFLFSIGPDGEVGQCDCWVSTQKNYNFGYLTDRPLEEILASEKRKPFLERPIKMIQDPECGICEFWKICYGGCPVRAYTFSEGLFSRDYYCSVYRRLFKTIVEKGRDSVTR